MLTGIAAGAASLFSIVLLSGALSVLHPYYDGPAVTASLHGVCIGTGKFSKGKRACAYTTYTPPHKPHHTQTRRRWSGPTSSPFASRAGSSATSSSPSTCARRTSPCSYGWVGAMQAPLSISLFIDRPATHHNNLHLSHSTPNPPKQNPQKNRACAATRPSPGGRPPSRSSPASTPSTPASNARWGSCPSPRSTGGSFASSPWSGRGGWRR